MDSRGSWRIRSVERDYANNVGNDNDCTELDGVELLDGK